MRELQKLPPGGTVCGFDVMGGVFVLSGLEGKALESFYTPLFAAVDCKPLTCQSNGGIQTECNCPTPKNKYAGRLLTKPGDLVYQLYFSP